MSETVIVQTALSVRTSYANSPSNCDGLCAILNVKVFAESMYCIHPKMLTPQKSSVSRCGTT